MFNRLNPVLDHANGQRASGIGTTPVSIAIPATTSFVRLVANGTRVFVRLDGTAIDADSNGSVSAAELSRCTVIEPNAPETLPVEVGVASISAVLESGSGASLSVVPFKARAEA